MTAPWRIEYVNDFEYSGYHECYEVTDDQRTFVADSKADADWLLTILSERDKTP